MNDETPVLLAERNNGVLSLTLNRPDSANALNPDLVEALIQAITEARNIHLCVIRGTGRHFCAGFDLSDLESSSDGDLLWRFLRIETLLQALYHAPFAAVALAQGKAIGAGADLFAACWRRVAAPGFKLKMPGWNFELALGTRRLTHLIGQDAARELLIDSKLMSDREAIACGLATDLLDQQEWSPLIDNLSQRAATLPPKALNDMLRLTTVDSRNQDIAAIVNTAGQPGLKNRILNYRDQP
ncbi:MAG: enoyl-CoA hydratase/isomerase family protein [Gammaproteobacteria bacterium]|nr:enoyl-CoA hydratase/isomerase family protein [Gammaproteobacteria bacterium]